MKADEVPTQTRVDRWRNVAAIKPPKCCTEVLHLERRTVVVALVAVIGAPLAALAMPCIALAQGSGPATANVEVYGTGNVAFGRWKYGDGANARTPDGAERATVGTSVSKWDVANNASNVGVRGRENLGGGLTAWFQIEEDAPLEQSNSPANKPASRNSAVGIAGAGALGNIFLGQWTTPWADLDALWAIGTVGFWGPVTSIIGRRLAIGTAPNYACVNAPGSVPGSGNVTANVPICDALQAGGGVGHPFWRRTSQSVFYQSPVMAGVQVKLSYQTNEGKSTAPSNQPGLPQIAANAYMYSTSVQWTGMGGAARVGVAYDSHHDFTTVGKSDSGYAVKGGWNFGVVDLGFAYEHMKYACGIMPFTAVSTAGAGSNAASMPALCADVGDIVAKQYAAAVAVRVGPGSIRASYSVAKDLTGPVGSAATFTAAGVTTPGTHISNTGAKQYNVGYEHRFSKRTNVGIGYATIDNRANAQFTWSVPPPNQLQSLSVPANTPLFGSSVSTYYASMTHRF